MRRPKPYSNRSGFAGRPSVATQPLMEPIATTGDGRDITRPYFQGLQQPRDPRLLGAVDWGVYDRILEDDQVFSTFQQRRRAVVSRNWGVLPGDDSDPRSVAAAEAFDATLKRIGWDRITDRMLFAILNGIAVAEVNWAYRDGLLDFDEIRVRHARRFRFDDKGALRLLTRTGGMGEVMPDRKFWVVTSGGGDDDELYGRGLAEWLYWPTLFKRNGLRFWNVFLDKFGTPTALGKYRPGTPLAQIRQLMGALQAIATDSGIAIPEGMAVELLQAARSGTADFEQLVRYMDEAIAKVMLSQTMTTQDGSSLSQAQVHGGVKLEVIKGDADLLSDGFNAGPARWWTDLNFGADVASPLVYRDCEEEADQKAQADTDQVLKGLGWERDDESFRDAYGDGYIRTSAGTQADATAEEETKRDLEPVPANDDEPEASEPPAKAVTSFAADDPRSLYVHRKLLNAADVIAWAREQGFPATLRADDMHVTIAYSRRPVNWLKMGGIWGWTGDSAEHLVSPGGPRLVDRIGGEGAIALHFHSGHLEQRHREMRDAGASWDFDAYLPHVTITYDAGDVDLTAIEPYRGELRFGPEIFEPLQEDWQARIQSASFADPMPRQPMVSIDDETAGDGLDDDAFIDQLITERGYRAAQALSAPVIDALSAATSFADVAATLALSPGDESVMAEGLERAGVALAIDAEAGATAPDDTSPPAS